MYGLGRFLILTGIVLIILGLLFIVFHKLPIGKFPGDIIIKKGNFTFYFPLGLSIIASIILTIIMYLIRK
ncbi:MAG: DUF2905 domain-containing protein [Deltaproteobacteria bacterium]|jgi:hypothetical protein|uniref:DUF2905 domain-containing protein n=1 Tax=Candidatus Acidulodesulfobacterium acidiphilum TaxID=2597224 RepID=A0A520XGC6_9DELT|nr:DUF2905 domain-containing protein [Deltaproteobacteria bacterium]MDA8299158.1 DUF2905 domain-containing protein [Deltaproteobacteria bacterium]RZV40257.1 MAG: DUF2905 domain-containing protein [Candidatus Acidulodesulfobacterium acidiphilum]